MGGELLCRPASILKMAAWSCAALLLATAGAHAQSAPLNDNFTNAIVLCGISGTTTGNNAGATQQDGRTSGREHLRRWKRTGGKFRVV